jgi:repressor LexA
MKALHLTQQKILDLLEAHIDSPLTIRELQEALDVSSPSVVHHHIRQLEKNGWLHRDPRNPKNYSLAGAPEKSIVYLNQYGWAQCGPDGSILDGVPVDKVPIASRLLKFPASEAFLVEARGDSMEPKIHSGDLIIAQRQNQATNGDIVVCVNQGETLVKKFIRQQQAVILHSLNSTKYDPFLADSDFRIEGIVRNVLQYN